MNIAGAAITGIFTLTFWYLALKQFVAGDNYVGFSDAGKLPPHAVTRYNTLFVAAVLSILFYIQVKRVIRLFKENAKKGE